MDYTVIVSILVFLGVAQLSAKFGLGVITSSILAVLPPFMLVLAIKLIFAMGYDTPLLNVFSLVDLFVFLAQLAIAILVFRQLEKSDDSYTSWFGWIVGGGFIIIFVIPFLLRSIVSS